MSDELKPTPTLDFNTINALMHEDPLNLSAQDIDTIIAYNRKLFNAYERGEKIETDAPKIDVKKLEEIGMKKPIVIQRRMGL